MKHLLVSVALTFVACLLAPQLLKAEYPKPSPYPISWELKFEHSLPKRIVVEIPGVSVPQAYWYMTYTVTNNTDKEQMFLPAFELLTRDGKVIRTDVSVPAKVFQTIKDREKKPFMEPYPKIDGLLRIGEDQARDGVTIWPEIDSKLGSFSIFVSGLSGEAVVLKDSKDQPVKDAQGNPVILRKTLQLNYFVRGDELYPGEDKMNQQPQAWVMR